MCSTRETQRNLITFVPLSVSRFVTWFLLHAPNSESGARPELTTLSPRSAFRDRHLTGVKSQVGWDFKKTQVKGTQDKYKGT